jgi:hypothetical protein
MASQALGFAELLVGGVLVTMGASGKSVREVLAGKGGLIADLPLDPRPGPGLQGPQGGGASRGTGAIEDPPLTNQVARLFRGVVDFEGTPVAAWIYPYLAYARREGWKGRVESGYRSLAEQTRIWNSGVRPAARPGQSNHEGKRFPRGAVDVTQAAELAHILGRLPGSLLRWAGNADPVHFSFPHGGSY